MLSKIKGWFKPAAKVYHYVQPYGSDGRPSPGFHVTIEADNDVVDLVLCDAEGRCRYHLEWDARSQSPISASRTF